MSACKISVIIPVFNAALYLRQCLDSVLLQSLSRIEIILINDASTDASQVIIDNYVATDDRVISVQLDRHAGVSAARNTGIEKAKGQYVIFLDADDYWDSPRMLQQLYDEAEKVQADLVSFGFCRVDDNANKSNFNIAAPAIVDLRKDNNWQIKYNVWAKLISKTLLIKQDIRFEPSLVMGEDALFSITLYCNARKMVTLDKAYYCYRINQTGANLSGWNEAKLFDTVNWFAGALSMIRGSDLYRYRPDVLQSVTSERLTMLFNKLGAMAFELLGRPAQQLYFEQWRQCFEYYERSYFEHRFSSNSNIEQYRRLLDLLQKNDLAGLGDFFNSEAYRQRVAVVPHEVTLMQQQAVQLGQDMLKQNKARIRCDFGSGVIITMPVEKAHRLAKQLIANSNPQITLKFY